MICCFLLRRLLVCFRFNFCSQTLLIIYYFFANSGHLRGMIRWRCKRSSQAFSCSTWILKGNIQELLLRYCFLSMVEVLNWAEGAFLLFFLFSKFIIIAVCFFTINCLLYFWTKRLKAIWRLFRFRVLFPTLLLFTFFLLFMRDRSPIVGSVMRARWQ